MRRPCHIFMSPRMQYITQDHNPDALDTHMQTHALVQMCTHRRKQCARTHARAIPAATHHMPLCQPHKWDGTQAMRCHTHALPTCHVAPVATPSPAVHARVNHMNQTGLRREDGEKEQVMRPLHTCTPQTYSRNLRTCTPCLIEYAHNWGMQMHAHMNEHVAII